jgi:RepA leader peptide Tap
MFTRNQKVKTPIIFFNLGGRKRLTGLINCIEAVALCREYMYMLRKLQAQFLCHSLLLCNISAGSGD